MAGLADLALSAGLADLALLADRVDLAGLAGPGQTGLFRSSSAPSKIRCYAAEYVAKQHKSVAETSRENIRSI